MHVDDIGAEGDVHRSRKASPICTGEDTVGAELEARARNFPTHDFPEPTTLARRDLCRLIEEGASLLCHSEASIREACANIFRGAARHRQFEIMNDRSAVGGERGENSLAQQIADERCETDF